MPTPDQPRIEQEPSKETKKNYKISDLMPIKDTGDLEDFGILLNKIQDQDIKNAQIDFEAYTCRGFFSDVLIDLLIKRNISLINTNFHKVQRNDLKRSGVIFEQASQERRMERNKEVTSRLREINKG